MNVKNLSEKFYNHGTIIFPSGNDNPQVIKKNKVIEEFEEKGIVVFKNYNFNKKSLWNFVKKFSYQFSNDADRRDIKFDNKNIRGVDPGNQEIKLHSESSFNTACPEIIWFYCNQAPSKNSKGGETTICDGIMIWDKLSLKTKKFFLANCIEYFLKIKINLANNFKHKRKWFLNNIGVTNPVLNPKTSTLDFIQKTFAVNETRLPGKLAFANHLLIDLKYEPQIIYRKIAGKKMLPKNINKEINKIVKKYTFKIKWQNGDLVMLDNKRFMHGRTKFKVKSKREIINVQTKLSNFGYGSTSRKI